MCACCVCLFVRGGGGFMCVHVLRDHEHTHRSMFTTSQ